MEISLEFHKEDNFPIVNFYITPSIFSTRFHPQLRKENMDHINQGFSIHFCWFKYDFSIRFIWRN